MNSTDLTKSPICPLCSRDMTPPELFSALIDEARAWYLAHPVVYGDVPAINNAKHMLIQGCDFAAVVLECVSRGWVVPAYANLRFLVERQITARALAFADGADWEYQGMARLHQHLSRKLQNSSPENQQWVKDRLAQIRHWNRPSEDANGKPGAYHFNLEEAMVPVEKEWYDRLSQFVHATYEGEQNVNRPFLESETKHLLRHAHLQLCSLMQYGHTLDEVDRSELELYGGDKQ